MGVLRRAFAGLTPRVRTAGWSAAVLRPTRWCSEGPAAAGAQAQSGTGEKAKQPWQKEKKKNAPVVLDGSVFDLRVGRVESVERHPDADTLYVELIDVGEDAPREICSGLVPHYEAGDIIHKHVLVMCNLKPAKMRGVVSHGMLLCSENADGTVRLCRPPAGAVAGDRITLPKYETETERPAQVPPKRVGALVAEFCTDGDGQVLWKDAPLTVDGKGVCKAEHADAAVR
eukprot:TRINITY_DN20118_c0_g1_i2.p2 TRINITY_DN20118_c0_g1~~TRINITY_DN20118_c0_g1_i2.p2  ORF type:complete len:244 (+),score=75.32 TRINITY_DN20118_c0_g1_i2:48-734(+)